MSVKFIEGKKPCQDGKFAIVVSRFNSLINERLLDGALDTLKREGEVPEENITVVFQPPAAYFFGSMRKDCCIIKI